MSIELEAIVYPVRHVHARQLQIHTDLRQYQFTLQSNTTWVDTMVRADSDQAWSVDGAPNGFDVAEMVTDEQLMKACAAAVLEFEDPPIGAFA